MILGSRSLTRSILVMIGLVLVLASVVLISSRQSVPEESSISRPVIWSIQFDELERISISLPRLEIIQAWIKGRDKYWYFDEPNGEMVDMKRWGGGVPILFYSPRAKRLISENPDTAQMAAYGFAAPNMIIELQAERGIRIGVVVGSMTVGLDAYYIKRTDSNSVYTIDSTWYSVLENLALVPPYPGS